MTPRVTQMAEEGPSRRLALPNSTDAHPAPMTLDDDDIDAVAARVVDILRTEQRARAVVHLIDAAALARILGVERDWVYAHARELGAVRLGAGPKARLRFDASRARAALAATDADDQAPPDKPRRRPPGRPRRRPAAAEVQLIRGRSSP